MDERKLTEMFRGAIPSVPPPSFDHRDVVAESDRQRARRRTALLGGSVLGIVVLAGAAVLSVALWMGTERQAGTAASAPVDSSGGSGNGEFAPNEVPSEGAGRSQGGGASDRSVPEESPKQGGTPTGNAGPPGPGGTPSGCEKADPELAAALAGELRVSPDFNFPVNYVCPVGSRGAALSVVGGTVSVIVTPPNAELASPTAGRPQETAVRSATASGGRFLILISEPEVDGIEPPHEAELQNIADRLAARLP